MKSMNPKQEIVKFVPRKDMVGKGGWKISGNAQTTRYNLTLNGKQLHYSHVNRQACVFVAKDRFGVEMKEME